MTRNLSKSLLEEQGTLKICFIPFVHVHLSNMLYMYRSHKVHLNQAELIFHVNCKYTTNLFLT